MKSYYLRFLGLILFSTLLSTSVFAQPQNTTLLDRPGNGGGEATSSPLIRNCNEPLAFDVYVANLELFLPDGDTNFSDGYFHLPDTVPDLYMELSVIGSGDYYSITELNSFEFSHVVNGFNIYKASVVVDLPSASNNTIRWESRLLMINDGSGSGTSPGFDSGNNSGNGTDIMLPNGETTVYEPVPGYLYYPIWNYRTSNSLFPCEVNRYLTFVYYWTDCYNDPCVDYGDNDDSCENPFPHYNGKIYCEGYVPPCTDCYPGEGISQSNTINDLQSNPIKFNSTNDVSISPNPFESSINIRFASEEMEILNIDIININGQVVQSFERSLWKGNNEINIKVDALPAGIYFIQLSNGIQTYTEKLMKH